MTGIPEPQFTLTRTTMRRTVTVTEAPILQRRYVETRFRPDTLIVDYERTAEGWQVGYIELSGPRILKSDRPHARQRGELYWYYVNRLGEPNPALIHEVDLPLWAAQQADAMKPLD